MDDNSDEGEEVALADVDVEMNDLPPVALFPVLPSKPQVDNEKVIPSFEEDVVSSPASHQLHRYRLPSVTTSSTWHHGV